MEVTAEMLSGSVETAVESAAAELEIPDQPSGILYACSQFS